jgi:hypothetical protein
VLTYPKCGTTWTEQAVLLLLNNADASLLDPKTKNSYRVGGIGEKSWLCTLHSIHIVFNPSSHAIYEEICLSNCRD